VKERVEFDVDAVHQNDWEELGTLLHQACYTTQSLRALLGLPDPAEEIVKNIGRYSLLCLDELSNIRAPLSVLVRLFMLSGRVPMSELECLDDSLKNLLRRTNLVVPAENDRALARGTSTITEVRRRYFSRIRCSRTGSAILSFTTLPTDACLRTPHHSNYSRGFVDRTMLRRFSTLAAARVASRNYSAQTISE
jgi:hypothetical protein